MLTMFSVFQPNLYPTVGLQTPGEVVEANFGQSPFVFDIEDYMRVCNLHCIEIYINESLKNMW